MSVYKKLPGNFLKWLYCFKFLSYFAMLLPLRVNRDDYTVYNLAQQKMHLCTYVRLVMPPKWHRHSSPVSPRFWSLEKMLTAYRRLTASAISRRRHCEMHKALCQDKMAMVFLGVPICIVIPYIYCCLISL